MAELNDKLITYGNLSTFYDKLQEQGLGGNAIEEVSVLPDASENKNKLFRLDNGEKDVYAAKFISSETITTNRLPDVQQIDKAYIYNDEEIYYYNGAWKVIFEDGELNGYGWLQKLDDNEWYLYTSQDDAVNATNNTKIWYWSFDDVQGVDFENHTVTYDAAIEYYQWEDADTINGDGGYVIPATYNAPESAQIGNACIVDDSLGGYPCYYTGEESQMIWQQEILTLYKWYNEQYNYIVYTTKKASDIYVLGSHDSGYYYDFRMISVNSSSIGRESSLHSIHIATLNAPDSEQVGNANVTVDGEEEKIYSYTGQLYTIKLSDDSEEIQGYWWNSNNDDLNPVDFRGLFTIVNANSIYSENQEVFIDIQDDEGNISISENVITISPDWGSIEESIVSFDTLSRDIYLGEGNYYLSTVKYQREEVTEEWDWQPLTDNATNDDIDLMFAAPENVKRVLMSDYASPLSIKEGLVNVNGETMEYDGQTYYKWVKYEEHDGESVIDDYGNDTELVVLTTSLNPSLPFSDESPEYAYHLVIDGEEGQYWGLDTYPEEALIHEDGSITYEE